MRKPVTLAFALLAAATAGEPYYMPRDLNAKAIAEHILKAYTKPSYVVEELTGAKVEQAETLLFRASVDDRPLLVEQCVIGCEITLGDKREWLLMSFYRHPYGPRVGHTEWTLNHIEGIHSDVSYRRLPTRPTNLAIQEYLQWSKWGDPVASDGFKDVQYLCFSAAWRSLTGVEPPDIKGAHPWPPKD